MLTSCSANAIATTNIAKSNNKLVPPLCIRFIICGYLLLPFLLLLALALLIMEVKLFLIIMTVLIDKKKKQKFHWGLRELMYKK